MKKNLFILLCWMLLAPSQVCAKEICFNTICFKIDDGFQTEIFPIDGSFKATKGDLYIILNKHKVESLHGKYKHLNRLNHPELEGAQLISTHNEPIYMLSKKYSIQEYLGKDQQKYLCFSTHTSLNEFYCAIACFHSEEEKQLLIKTYESSWWNIKPLKKIFLSYTNASYRWIFIFAVFFLLGVYSKGEKHVINRRLLLITLVVASPIFLVVTIHAPILFVTAILSGCAFFILGATVSP